MAGWGWNAPILAVVDYASASARDLHAWLKELADNAVWYSAEARHGFPLRLLLLERQAQRGSGWWAEVFGRGDDAAVLEKLSDPAEPVTLRPLDDADQRRAILTQTLASLGSTVTLPAAGDDPDFDRRLAELTWAGVPLLLMRAAVTVAREGFGQVLAMGSQDLAFSVAETELARILKVVEGQNVSTSLAPLVKHVAAVATLRQGLTSEAAREMIEQENGKLGYNLPHGSAALRDALAMALPNDGGGIAAVEPDMIGEALLLDVWREDSIQALPAIARAYVADPDAVAKTVIRTCQDYVIRGHRHPLNWLEKIRADSTDLYALIHLCNAMPTHTVELREIAAELDNAVVRQVAPPVGDIRELDQVMILAASLNNLSNRFADLGQRERALAAIEKAVLLYREVTRILPDVGRTGLANSLSNLSKYLSDLGQRERALAASEEAVEIFRDLAAARPDAFRPDLAMSLNMHSICFSHIGRREEALAAIEEAVAIRRALAAANPDAFRPDLSQSLLNLSACLSNLGRQKEALAAVEETVTIGRALAAARPDAFRSDLAMSLNNLSNCFFDLGRWEEGLVAIEEGVALYRDLAATGPDAFRPDLAKSLSNLSLRYSNCSRYDEALVTIEEAVATLREPFLAQPIAFMQQMGLMLSSYLERCKEVGREEPDPALWTPIVETLQRLKDQSVE